MTVAAVVIGVSGAAATAAVVAATKKCRKKDEMNQSTTSPPISASHSNKHQRSFSIPEATEGGEMAAVGNADVLAALASVKSNLDSGVFQASQHAASTALLRYDDPSVRASVDIYRARRDQLVAGLRSAGWRVNPPEATFYVWAKLPPGVDSASAAKR